MQHLLVVIAILAVLFISMSKMEDSSGNSQKASFFSMINEFAQLQRASEKGDSSSDSLLGKKVKVTRKVQSSSFKLRGVDALQPSIIVMQPETIAYIKKNPSYARSYSKGKKFVVYYSTNPGNCPYVAAFINYMEKIKVKPEYARAYDFHAVTSNRIQITSGAEMIAAKPFVECGAFCVVNPKRDELLGVGVVNMYTLDLLPKVLAQLQNW